MPSATRSTAPPLNHVDTYSGTHHISQRGGAKHADAFGLKLSNPSPVASGEPSVRAHKIKCLSPCTRRRRLSHAGLSLSLGPTFSLRGVSRSLSRTPHTSIKINQSPQSLLLSASSRRASSSPAAALAARGAFSADGAAAFAPASLPSEPSLLAAAITVLALPVLPSGRMSSRFFVALPSATVFARDAKLSELIVSPHVRLRRADVDKHERLRVAAEAVLQQVGQLRVAVRHVLLVRRERRR